MIATNFFYNRKTQQHLLEKLYESEFETQAMYGCLYSKVWLTEDGGKIQRSNRFGLNNTFCF